MATQKVPPQRELTIFVLNARSDPSQPVQGARVSLSFVAGSEKVVDARDATNRAGQAWLLVSPEDSQRGDLRIEITGVSDLVGYEPANGQQHGLPASVTIKLLPKSRAGSGHRGRPEIESRAPAKSTVSLLLSMAEREGFEPPIALRLCLISSQVHSTGLCHLSAF